MKIIVKTFMNTYSIILERVKTTSIKNQDPKTLNLLIEIVEKIGGLFSNYDSHCIDLSLDLEIA